MANLNQGGYPQPMDTMNNRNFIQYPYNNNLISNTPYENYLGRSFVTNQPIQTQYLKCRPVSSKEEARAFQIDLDGSLWVFTDIGNEKIYTKQINNDGKASFKTYAFVQDEFPNANTEYVTKSEFQQVIQALTAAIQSKQNQTSAQNSDNKPEINF